ncbi:MAG: ribonuclease D [Nitrospirota bacterium]|nr:ribonuclease D [Nitrospirota bacterium]
MNWTIKPDLTEADVMRIRESKIIAVDTETAGLNPARDALYVMQICDKNGQTEILRNRDWKAADNIRDILIDPTITKVIQFAIMDCGFIVKHMGVMPQNVYCTKIASKLARTYAPSHSLSSLVGELIGTPLDKKQQSTFWGREELSAEQLEYASADVKWLLGIKDTLENILETKGTLPTGISYTELNRICQSFIPSLVHLWLNGWDFGKEDPASLFGR